jgi:hypothetical protein
MLKLNGFSHNHHPPRVKMLAKYIRRGISVDICHILGILVSMNRSQGRAEASRPNHNQRTDGNGRR